MGPIKYLPQKFSFSFQTHKTRHFCDVSATEGFVAYVARVRVLTCMGPIKCLSQKTSHFRCKLLKHATFVMCQQQKFCCIYGKRKGSLRMGPVEYLSQKI